MHRRMLRQQRKLLSRNPFCESGLCARWPIACLAFMRPSRNPFCKSGLCAPIREFDVTDEMRSQSLLQVRALCTRRLHNSWARRWVAIRSASQGFVYGYYFGRRSDLFTSQSLLYVRASCTYGRASKHGSVRRNPFCKSGLSAPGRQCCRLRSDVAIPSASHGFVHCELIRTSSSGNRRNPFCKSGLRAGNGVGSIGQSSRNPFCKSELRAPWLGDPMLRNASSQSLLQVRASCTRKPEGEEIYALSQSLLGSGCRC